MMEKSSHCDGILQDPEFRRTSKCLFYGNRLKERSFLIFPFKKDCKSIDYEKVIVDGFDQPILVDAGTDIGITVPKRDVSLIEVAKLIGIHVPVKIIEVGTQSEIVGWTFGQYIEYLRRRGPNHKILNLISLEFSMTPMSNFVHAPEIVRKIDWIDVLWPLNKRTHGDYPQVQKYCLTGMAGSYTDFHIDFGGTSVWYHVVWGCKRFFLIDPTCANLKAYEKWSCNPNQDQVFLGDVVDRCYQVDVMPGQTFFIPSKFRFIVCYFFIICVYLDY